MKRYKMGGRNIHIQYAANNTNQAGDIISWRGGWIRYDDSRREFTIKGLGRTIQHLRRDDDHHIRIDGMIIDIQ